MFTIVTYIIENATFACSSNLFSRCSEFESKVSTFASLWPEFYLAVKTLRDLLTNIKSKAVASRV